MLNKHYTLNDERTEINLDLSTRHEWLQDDSFFRDAIRQCNLSEPIYFVIDRMQDGSLEVAAQLENRIIPNLIYSLSPSLGYEPSIGILREYIKDHEITANWTIEPEELDTVSGVDAEEMIDMDMHLMAVDIVKEPVNPDCLANKAISTTQPKTTKKRKLEK